VFFILILLAYAAIVCAFLNGICETRQMDSVSPLPQNVSVKPPIEKHIIVVEIPVVKEVVVEKPIRVVEIVEVPVEKQKVYSVSSVDRELIARVMFLEFHGQGGANAEWTSKAIASVIFNRWTLYGGTINDVIYQENVFSVVGAVDNTTPTEAQYAALDYVIENGSVLPLKVIYFRNKNYHSWGIDYKEECGVYFSYTEDSERLAAISGGK
jgi:hypothetical protein